MFVVSKQEASDDAFFEERPKYSKFADTDVSPENS
jgi:hypothetical protein